MLRFTALGKFPKGPCTHIVYTLALKYSLYRYIGPKVYTIWVHGPLGIGWGLGFGLTCLVHVPRQSATPLCTSGTAYVVSAKTA